MVARSGRRIIRPREWMEIAKNSRKRMCTGGCPAKAEGGCDEKGDPVPLRQFWEPTPVAKLLYRCSINKCGWIDVELWFFVMPQRASSCHIVTKIINNCVDRGVVMLRRTQMRFSNIFQIGSNFETVYLTPRQLTLVGGQQEQLTQTQAINLIIKYIT